MKTYYQTPTSDFAINGVIAVSMSDEIRKQLEGKQDFLDEKSKEVQAYLSAVAERDAKQLADAEAAQDAEDDKAALAELLEEHFGDRLKERREAKRKERQAQRKADKVK